MHDGAPQPLVHARPRVATLPELSSTLNIVNAHAAVHFSNAAVCAALRILADNAMHPRMHRRWYVPEIHLADVISSTHQLGSFSWTQVQSACRWAGHMEIVRAFTWRCFRGRHLCTESVTLCTSDACQRMDPLKLPILCALGICTSTRRCPHMSPGEQGLLSDLDLRLIVCGDPALACVGSSLVSGAWHRWFILDDGCSTGVCNTHITWWCHDADSV